MRVSLGIGSVGVKGDQMNRYLGRVAQSRSTVGSASSPSSRIPCLTKARSRRSSAAASNLVIGPTRTLDELEWSPRGRSCVATDRRYPPARKLFRCWRLTDSDWGGAGPSQSGRVGMWRGGVRLNISVAAPFVWRCLTGSTLAPFPHPAHRTGHADLSGSAAIAGFCPHRTHRAALPQWALQEGPDAD